jgi:DNA-binding Lrp family transcriptional regulator
MLPGGIRMDEIDLRLLSLIQEGFPLTSKPFEDLGGLLGLEEKEVIERLDGLQKEGVVRRIGPILDLRRLGRSGILAALQVSAEDADGLAEFVNQYQEVSHNYLRPNESGYNMWFTISATEERIQEVLEEFRKGTGRKMLVLPTGRIFKIGVKFDIMCEEE